MQKVVLVLAASLLAGVAGRRVKKQEAVNTAREWAGKAKAAEAQGQGAQQVPLPLPFREFYPDPTLPAKRQHYTLVDSQVDACTHYKMSATRQGCDGEACDVVFVGDSITEALNGMQCFNKLLQIDTRTAFLDSFPNASDSLLIAGGGDQTANTLYTLQEVLPFLHAPTAFFVMIGTNNIGNNWSTPEQTAAGVRAVVNTLQARFPTAALILHPLLPRADDEVRPDVILNREIIGNTPWQATLDATNALLKAFARAEGSGVLWADCTTVFPRGAGPDAQALMPDFLHPNAAGYAAWFRCLNPMFKEVLSVEADDN